MTSKEAITWLKAFKYHTGIPELTEAFVIAIHAIYRDIKIREILNKDCGAVTKYVFIRDLYENKEVDNGQVYFKRYNNTWFPAAV